MVDVRKQGWIGWVPENKVLHGHRPTADIGHTLQPQRLWHLQVIRCITCQHHWIRNVRPSLMPGQLGAWLCPAGWGNGCLGAYFITVDRPDVEAAWRLSGRYGYGDTWGAE